MRSADFFCEPGRREAGKYGPRLVGCWLERDLRELKQFEVALREGGLRWTRRWTSEVTVIEA